MPPNARANVLRGPGRPKKATAPEPTSVTKTQPAKRGRPARVDPVEVAVEPPKKRGRPSKANIEEEPAPVSKIRGLRTAKDEAPSTPKRKPGRPAKTPALDRVVASPRASPRVAKRTKTSNVPATRIDPRMRARLRTRLPAAQQASASEPVRQPGKRAKRGPGRPPKVSAQAPTTKSVTTRGKVAKPTKQSGPRKRRGYTMLEVPDKFVAQVKQTIDDLLHGDAFDNASTSEQKEALPVLEQGALDDENSQDEADPGGDNELDVDLEDDDQEGHVEDEVTGEILEPSEEVELELHVQQIVEVEEIPALDNTSPLPEVHHQLAVRHGDFEVLQSPSNSEHDVGAFVLPSDGRDTHMDV